MSTCQPVTCYMAVLSTCQPVYLSTCRPVTCNMAIYGVCILLRGGGGGGLEAGPQVFRCESMPTPLYLTFTLPYDCPCFARMRNSFTLPSTSQLSSCRPVNLSICRPVNLSTRRPVNPSTCRPINLSTCRPVNLSTCRPVNLSVCQPVNILLAITCVQYTSDVLSALVFTSST